MTHTEYIKATNLIKVRMAREILLDMLPGEKYSVNPDSLSQVLDDLYIIIERIGTETDIVG